MTSIIEFNEIEETLEIFRALSSKTRLYIVMRLICKHECSVNAIADELKIPQPNISQHLTVLRNAGIIEGYRRGNQICYKVINFRAEEIIRVLKLKY